MQWSTRKNGGFSQADEKELVCPVIKEGKFGYQKLNVVFQQKDPDSLLNWMEKLIRVRIKCIEFGHGNYTFLNTGDNRVMAHSSMLNKEISVVLHNLSKHPVKIKLDLYNQDISELNELFADDVKYSSYEKGKPLEINPYGYRWFKGKLCSYYHS